MFVEHLLSSTKAHLVTIRHEAQLIDAARILSDGNIDLVVICDPDGAMVGVITKTDIVRRISHCNGNSCTTNVSQVMSRNVLFCHPGVLLAEAWSQMKQKGLKHMPVVDDGLRPLGVLQACHAVQALLTEVENEEDLLRDYVQGIGYR